MELRLEGHIGVCQVKKQGKHFRHGTGLRNGTEA